MPENLRVEQNETSLIWDGFGLQNLHSGVGYHAWALHQALTQLGRTPSILASTPDVELGFQPWLLGAHWPLFRMKPWSLWVARQGLSSLLRKDSTKNFIFHGLSNYNIPSNKSKRLRKVLTLHDLIPIIAEDQVSLALATYMKWQLPRALRAADAIICVSSWTERELIDRYPFV
ncbi:MAG: glycosyltransferase, partial [Proteobacteria bacterium]|nr:glycosyltransferase [Pseudomonadota bacterium]